MDAVDTFPLSVTMKLSYPRNEKTLAVGKLVANKKLNFHYQRNIWKNAWIGWILVLPLLLIRGFTTIYPVSKTLYNSFFDMHFLTGGGIEFVGLENYSRILSDQKLLTSVEFTLLFTFFSMIFHLIFGIGLALLLNAEFRGRKFLRTIVLIPWAMPMIVVGIAGKWAFNDMYGIVNDLIRRVFTDFHFDWLVYSWSARLSVILVDLWKDVPFFAIVVLAALQFINRELYEAAEIDGAGSVKSFWYITLPLIMKPILTIGIFFTMWRLSSFDIVYAMTSGGPGDSTTLLAYRIRMEAFTNMNLGYASAIAMLLFLLMIVTSSIILYITSKIDN
jgi:multiple sugar transport system permease protein